jgi:hypothetical protein
MDHPAVGPHFDLDEFGVFRVAATQQGLAAAWADTSLRGQFEGFLAEGEMGVIPSLGTRVPRLLAPVPLGTLVVVVEIIPVIGAIVSRSGFGASSEEIGLELAFFAFKLFDLLLQRGDAAEGVAMTRLPISDLLAEFEVLALQALDVLTEFEVLALQALNLGTQGGHFLAHALHQGDEI